MWILYALLAWLILDSLIVLVLFLCRNKSVYLVCPVRSQTPEQQQEIDRYVEQLEDDSYLVHYPPRDVDQNDPVGDQIVSAHRRAMQQCGRVDIFWDVKSFGSHFDLGMAIALGKPLRLVKSFQPDNEGKSFLKVIQMLQQ
jgi:hypothetical protein